jgi:hypothetical protein
MAEPTAAARLAALEADGLDLASLKSKIGRMLAAVDPSAFTSRLARETLEVRCSPQPMHRVRTHAARAPTQRSIGFLLSALCV